MARTGITEWTNDRNGFFVCQVHYTADPTKRIPTWKAQRQADFAGNKKGYEREYEISWTSPAGEPVIPEFDRTLHTRQNIPVLPDRRGLRFWDFGFVSPVVLLAQTTLLGQLRFLRELCPFNVTLDDLIPMAMAMGLELFPSGQIIDAGDPEANSNKDLGQIRERLQRQNIFLHTNRRAPSDSYDDFRERFKRTLFSPQEGHIPAIIIDTRCVHLCEALSGAFHRSPHPPYRPVAVHPYKDVTDAARYGNDNISAGQGDFVGELARMAQSDVHELRVQAYR